MSVTVRTTDRVMGPLEVVHDNGVSYDVVDTPHGQMLRVVGANGKRVAVYAPCCWASAQILPGPEPAPAVNTVAAGGVVSPTLASSGPDEREAFVDGVLSETAEPYVTVSVTGPDPDTVAKTLQAVVINAGPVDLSPATIAALRAPQRVEIFQKVG
jgi:hypothetical protein